MANLTTSKFGLKQSALDKFLPILLDSLRLDSVLDFDLYIHVGRELVLYRSRNLPFNDRTRQNLIENRVDRLYVSADDKPAYQRYIEHHLDQIFDDPSISEEKKASVLYETSTNLVRDVLANPTFGENIHRSQELVANTVSFILRGREAFLSLMQISSFDYYTYTHSVNVCTFAISLAQQLGINDLKVLNELGTGALLHDIGKSKISDRILNKKSPLTPLEFEIMKKHPRWGVEILKETNTVPVICHLPVLEHHERGDRRGYPSGLSLDEMHLFSRIIAIVDSFDAMTTERVYQHAKPSFEALKLMLSMKDAYDTVLLRAFIDLMGPDEMRSGSRD